MIRQENPLIDEDMWQFYESPESALSKEELQEKER